MPKHAYFRQSVEIEVPFLDVDSMDIVWHGNYVKYLEVARCALLDEIGYNYRRMRSHGYEWPVVKLDIKYIRPALFAQKIRVETELVEYESSMKIEYTVRDAESGAKLTRASTTQVAVEAAGGEMQFQTPALWQDTLRSHPGFRQPETSGQ